MSNTKTRKPTTKERNSDMKDTELEEAIARNDEEWMKRMLLLVLTMIVALLGID